MKSWHFRLFLFGLLTLAVGSLHAQWITTTYTLKGGWNSLYLHGDVPQQTVEELFASEPGVLAVWRWNPNPTPTQFSATPALPTPGTPEWTKWVRGAPNDSSLINLTGQRAYLVQCAGTASTTYTVPITQKVIPPSTTWVRNGANFIGFPARSVAGVYPTFASYFATFPAAIAASSKIYKYIGGDLGPGNPLQVFSAATERLDRNQAYWFESAVVDTFVAPLEITVSPLSGLTFGRTGTTATVRLRNRSAAAVTLTVAPVNSVAAPVGQPDITGPVPLTLRTLNTTTAQYEETAIAVGGFNQVLPPQGSVELTFGLNRAAMTGASGAFYASLLRFTDSGNLLDVSLPATASVASLAGLWLGDIAVDGVVSKVPGSPGSTTAKPFSLRSIFHVSDAGQASLLSQVFLGTLDLPTNPFGLCVTEAKLLASAKGTARRYVATHLPLNTVLSSGSGSFALGGTLTRTVVVPFDDPTNPFVHAYHPDHDNRDARFAPLSEGIESYTVTRTCSFTFTTTPPAGVSSIGWGSSVIGGTYQETLAGLHREPITLTGTFILRRVSELGTLTLP